MDEVVKEGFAESDVIHFDERRIATTMYRPYVQRVVYFDRKLIEMPNLMPSFFGEDAAFQNEAIVFTDPTSQKPFMALGCTVCPDMHLVGAGAGSVAVPRITRRRLDPVAFPPHCLPELISLRPRAPFIWPVFARFAGLDVGGALVFLQSDPVPGFGEFRSQLYDLKTRLEIFRQTSEYGTAGVRERG
jgi:hypothetical protein